MGRTDRVAGCLLLVFSVWYGAVALVHYPYTSSTGPGSGFFPLWLGVALGVLAALLIVTSLRDRTEPGTSWLPRGQGLVRLATVVVATAVFIALLPVLGMSVATVLFLVTILRFVERYAWTPTLAVAIGTAVVNYLVFAYWLRVPLPRGITGF